MPASLSFISNRRGASNVCDSNRHHMENKGAVRTQTLVELEWWWGEGGVLYVKPKTRSLTQRFLSVCKIGSSHA